MDLINQIKKITTQICDDELTQIGLEEGLLLTLAKSQKQRLSIKKTALNRIAEINRRQLKILGDISSN